MTTEHPEEPDESPSSAPAPQPKEEAKKETHATRDMLIGVAAVAVAAILLAIYTMPRMLGAAVNFNSGPGVDIQAQDATARARATNAQSNTAGRLLSSGRGTGDEVSADFTVPAGCNRQTITYEAESTGGFDGWVNFRVPFVDGQGGESLGPAEANDNPTGSGLWTLTPGTYAIEVESWHARWSYELKCR